MTAEGRFHRGRIKSLKDVADGGMGRGATPFQREGGVQPVAMDVDKGDDAAIGVAAADDGEDGEQQHVWQLVELSLRPPRIRNIRQYVQQ